MVPSLRADDRTERVMNALASAIVPEAAADPILTISELRKEFLGETALAGVDLDLYGGRVRALVGHNGSGKSTLIKILAGYHVPDGGSVELGGKSLHFGDADSAHRLGLRFIHQDLGLIDNLSVLENLRLSKSSYQVAHARRIRWRYERGRAAELLARFHLDAHPDALVRDLTSVQRTQLAIARALQDPEGARVLILDEPSARLPASEVEQLFAAIGEVKSAGVAVMYVSHRLEEIHAICDEVTILKDGEIVAEGRASQVAREEIAKIISGGNGLGDAERRRRSTFEERPEPLLDVCQLAGGPIKDLSFLLRRGEILGLIGLAGSGANDFPMLLTGEVPRESGSVFVAGDELRSLNPSGIREAGIAVLPTDRALKAALAMSVRENLTLPELGPLWRRGLFRHRQEKAECKDWVSAYGVVPAETERPFATLSGGNQQKVAVAKWMRTRPSVLVVEEPTAGVDVRGKTEIVGLIREAADRGTGVVVASSDLEDVELLCDRVLIVRGGKVRSELRGGEITRERIGRECYPEDEPND